MLSVSIAVRSGTWEGIRRYLKVGICAHIAAKKKEEGESLRGRKMITRDDERRKNTRATGIFIQIDDNRFSVEEKLEAIKAVLGFSAFGMIHKADMLAVIEWLVELYEEKK